MKFYVVQLPSGEVLGCGYSQRAAIAVLRGYGGAGRVQRITLGVPLREAVRRLLGDMGGYASKIETVYERDDA